MLSSPPLLAAMGGEEEAERREIKLQKAVRCSNQQILTLFQLFFCTTAFRLHPHNSTKCLLMAYDEVNLKFHLRSTKDVQFFI